MAIKNLEEIQNIPDIVNDLTFMAEMELDPGPTLMISHLLNRKFDNIQNNMVI